MRELLFIGAGGALGAVSRFLFSRGLNRLEGWLLPVGTIGVNVVGAFCLGLFLEIAAERLIGSDLRAFLAIGFLGSFTTFSTFSLETIGLLREYQYGSAAANAFGSLFLGLGAGILGIALARLILR